MIRLPTPFEARARHSADAGGAGGCTTSSCTCCLVTFSVISLVTSMHFARLKLPGKPPAEGEATSQPAVVGSPHGRLDWAMALMGFFQPWLSLFAVFPFLAGNFAAFIFSAGLWITLWSAFWTMAYRRASRGALRGTLLGLIGFVAMLLLSYAEIHVWEWWRHVQAE